MAKTRTSIMRYSIRQLVLLLCVMAVVYPLINPLALARTKASVQMYPLEQSSPLSPLIEPAQGDQASAPAIESSVPIASSASQTSLVLVAVVLVGVLIVSGLVLWRQR